MCEDYKDAEKAEEDHWTAQDEKIAELERIVVAAKDCVEITQKRNDKLHSQLEGMRVNRDILFKENERYRQSLLSYNKKMDVTKEQIKALLVQINKLQASNSVALEHIWNNLKLVKIEFC